MTSNFVSIHSRFSFMYFIPVQAFKGLFDWSSVLTQICVVDKVLFNVLYSLGKQSGSKWKTGTELLMILTSLSWSCFLSLMFFVLLIKTTQHRLWRGKSLSYNGLNWFVFYCSLHDIKFNKSFSGSIFRPILVTFSKVSNVFTSV